MTPEQLKQFKQIHIEGWNERDRSKRDALLGKIYAQNIKMYDSNTVFDGLKAVSDFVGQLPAQDPDFHFYSDNPMEGLQDSIRFYGKIRTGQGILNSMDFFLLENGKAAHLYAFLEPEKVVGSIK